AGARPLPREHDAGLSRGPRPELLDPHGPARGPPRRGRPRAGRSAPRAGADGPVTPQDAKQREYGDMQRYTEGRTARARPQFLPGRLGWRLGRLHHRLIDLVVAEVVLVEGEAHAVAG